MITASSPWAARRRKLARPNEEYVTEYCRKPNTDANRLRVRLATVLARRARSKRWKKLDWLQSRFGCRRHCWATASKRTGAEMSGRMMAVRPWRTTLDSRRREDGQLR